MKKFCFSWLFILLLSAINVIVAQSPTSEKKALSNRIANYDMWVQLNPETKIVNGDMVINWKNTSPDTIKELHFHLYMNAFKNSRSTFLQETGGGMLRGLKMDKEKDNAWGYCNVQSITDVQNNELIKQFQYFQPDDTNSFDQTVARLTLNNPVLPNDSVVLKLKFETKMPVIFARAGFADNYFLVAQWFPKLGVYEHSGIRGAEKGRWNCHQYHGHSEFYADFSVYNVDITLPADFVVGATGVQTNEKSKTDGTKILSFRADDVVDFAWTASQRFKIVNSEWNDVKIHLLLQPEHFSQADRHLEALKYALEYFNQHVGPYPYPQITVVDPPMKGFGSAGMEYPMFITAGTLWNLPKGLRFPENVTIHEFGHNYFMGILATNEFEEAWMDEGMNTYFETRIMDDYYGKNNAWIDFPFYQEGDLTSKIKGYNFSDANKVAPSYLYSWHYNSGGYRNDGYGMMSYNKPAVFLSTLERMLGRETMDNIWRKYYDEWKFKHPSTEDFINLVVDNAALKYQKNYNADIRDFLKQSIYGTDICDYTVSGINNDNLTADAGLFDKNGKIVKLTETEKPAFKYLASVSLQRLGEFVVPVEVKVTFANGEEKITLWDGKSRTHVIKFLSDSKIVSAYIDPSHKNVMDVNLLNNSYAFKTEKSGIYKLVIQFLFAMQNFFQFFSAFI